MIQNQKEQPKYKFGDDQQTSLGYILIRIPIKWDRFIKLHIDVVPVDVLFLIGLDFLDRYKLYGNTVDPLSRSRYKYVVKIKSTFIMDVWFFESRK